MSSIRSFTTGLKRVFHTPALACWIYLATIALALPLTSVMRNTLRESVGSSLVHQNLRRSFDLDWYGEFASSRTGMAKTFGPGVVGVLPMLSNLERLLDGMLLETDGTVLAVGILFLLVWAFFGGGIIGRYARPDEPYGRTVLFADSARYFFRFLRLLVLSVVVYLALARWLAGPLFSWAEKITRDATAEKTAMIYTAVAYAIFVLVLIFVGMAMDYAKIAIVLEERRSALLALIRGIGFILSHPLRCWSIYVALLFVGGLWLAAYAAIAPGPNQSTYSGVILAFVAGQAYLLGRLILKLWFLSSQTLLFESAFQVAAENMHPQMNADGHG